MEKKVLAYAVGYARSVVDDISGEAIRKQETLLKQYCEDNTLKLLNIFNDKGISGVNFNRPGWYNLMQFLEQNKELVCSLIVVDLNRLSRNATLSLLEINNLEQNYGITITSIQQPHFDVKKRMDLQEAKIERRARSRKRKK